MPRFARPRYKDPLRRHTYPTAPAVPNESPNSHFAYLSSQDRWLARHWWIRPPDPPNEEPPRDQTNYWYQLNGEGPV
jgi:hypothetical protein